MNVQSRLKSFYRDGRMVLYGVFNGRLSVIDAGIRPYFFVRVENVSDVRKMDGVDNISITDLKYRDEHRREHRVAKVECSDSKNVAKIRGNLMQKGIESYEADIPFTRRCLIDYDVIVDYSSSVCYVDIELNDKYGLPFEHGKYEIVSVALFDQNGRGDWFYIGDYDSEKQRLESVFSWLRENNKTVICGWNVGFDYGHLLERGKNLGLNVYWLEMSIPLDLQEKYEGTVKGLESYSLEEVSAHEGHRQKKREKKIHEMTRNELMEYNMYDAELCYLIDKDYGFSELQAEVAAEVNLTMDELSPVKIGDALVLRRMRELGYVAKNVGVVESKSYRGAWVKTPISGVHKNVLYLDYEAMYPNIIIYEKIDIDGFVGEVLPVVVENVKKKRMEYKEKYKETGDKKWDVKQKAMKPILNALYGILGNRYFRYFDVEKAELVTKYGRELAHRLEKVVNELFGFEVIYVDTDSSFVKVENVGNVKEFAKILEDEINEYLSPYAVKVEDVFKAILFLKSVDASVGAKKRYVGVTFDGRWVWRGVEKRRRDWCRLAKEVQEEVVRRILVEEQTKEEILKYLADIKRRMYDGEFDDKLIITKRVRDIKDYKVRQPHVRALEKALKRVGINEGKIRFVYVGGDVEPLLSDEDLERFKGKLNYKYYWGNQVYAPAMRLLRSLDGGKQQKLFGGEKR